MPAPTLPSPSQSSEHDALLAFLASRNVGCPACDYNLRDLQSNICPECGVTLPLDTILAADPGFPRRRRRLLRTAGIVALVGLFAPALAAAFAPGPNLPLVFLPPVGVLISLVATGIATVWDSAIYADRIRFPRARNIPTFAPVVHTLVFLFFLEIALDLILCIVAVLA